MFNDYVDNLETLPATTRSQRKLDGDLIVRLLPILILSSLPNGIPF